ncbi:MAG TPA: CapA family protein [Tenuifilaceae bacterium]|nr:CapA family protein [Tenuifilaceae bacterium]HPI45211.1 CapA family protein [Tenuifilaceae bacterium]HPN20742.1 CapA family protein [Tenuifilaceae bacterium]HPV56301.1 CapA family protein [Tenuifilaceae bacterium]
MVENVIFVSSIPSDMKPFYLTLSFLLIGLISPGQNSKTLNLIFVGDVMGHSPQINSAYDEVTKTYSYDSVFTRMKGVFSYANIVIANLEVTLAGEPYSGYPQFSSPDNLVDGLMSAGVDVLVTANNHSVDRGKDGIIRTIDVLSQKGIPHTGTFKDSAHRETINPLIIDKNGFRLGLLNYTYGTNGIPVPLPVIVNLIDTALIRKDVEKTKALGVDEVIVFIHWGNEYETNPSKTQIKLAEFMKGLGVRIIIGSHPHVVQRMEATFDTDSTTGQVVVYSLGNFVSNQRKRYCNGGVVTFVQLSKNEVGKTQITNTGYIPVWVHIPFRDLKRLYQVLPVSEYEPISKQYFSTADDSLFTEFKTDTYNLLNMQNVNFPEIKYKDGKWLFPETQAVFPFFKNPLVNP